jgi:hypothetical protein
MNKEAAEIHPEWDLVIEPQNSLFELHLKDVWRYRDLLWLLVKRDFVSFYKQTILGPLWFFIQPLLTTAMFTVIFSGLAKLPTDGLPPILFYLSGLVPWGFFGTTLTKTSQSFIAQASLLKLAAQGEHLGVHRAGATAERGPRHPQQLLAAAHHPRGHEQGTKQGKFPWTQLDRLVPQGYLAEQDVNFKRTNADPLLQTGAAAAQQGAAPGRQLLKAKGLPQHIVGAGIESLHPIRRVAAGGEQQQRQAQACGPGTAAELEAAQTRQHPIEDR